MNWIKKIILLLLLCLLGEIGNVAKSYADDDINYRMLAGFVYSFPNLIQNHSGKVCVFGYDQMTVALADQDKSIVSFNSEEDLVNLKKDNCAVLYIARDKSRSLRLLTKYTDPNQVVTVGLFDSFVDEGGIILIQMGRRNIELTVNHDKIKALGVKFDPLLSGLIVN